MGHVTPQLFYTGHVTPPKCAILVMGPEKVCCIASIEREVHLIHPRKYYILTSHIWHDEVWSDMAISSMKLISCAS